MSTVVDARGLSCPVPVMRAVAAMDRAGPREVLEVVVDTATARDNVVRVGRLKGWSAEVRGLGEDFAVVLSRGGGGR